MKKELIGILICTLLISVAVATSTAFVPNIKNMTNNELVSKPVTIGKTIYVDDNKTEGPWDGTIEHPYQYIQDGNKLTRKHLLPLIINYYYIEKDSVKKIIKDIIIELIFTGDATIEEILQIVDNSGLNPAGVYILSLIETTDWSDGLAYCYPGNMFVYLFGYNSRGSYVRYKKDSGSIYGWHLEIDRNEVSKKSGHAIGYYGYVHSGIAYYYPGEYPGFEMVDGFSLIVFHGC